MEVLFVRNAFMKKWSSLLVVMVMLCTVVIPVGSYADTTATVDTIQIITFNDFHGSLTEDTREGRNAGMVKMMAAIRELKAAHPNTIVVSGGDNYQGSAMSNLLYGKPVSEMMKNMGVVASAVGNHEFDWGTEWMTTWSKEGGFPFLASNIYDTATNEPVKWAQPYVMVEEKGVKIAFIGLAHPDTATLTKAQYVDGLEFRDPVKAAQTWIDFLKAGKAEEGTPDVIIALSHLDSFQNKETKAISGSLEDVAQNVKGIDAIVSAHSHQEVVGSINNVPIVQAKAYGRLLGVLTLTLEDGKVKSIEPSVDPIGVRKIDLVPTEDEIALFEKYNKEVEPVLNEVVGTAKGEFTHSKEIPNVTPLGEWASEVMRVKTGVQVAIQNGGGLRRTLEAGQIKMGDLYEIMPFDNALVTFDLPGKDLKKAIDHGILNPEVGDGQFAGLKVVYDETKEFENRIVSITLADGTPIKDDAYYSVVANDFMFTGGDKYDFSNAKNVVETYIPVRDVLVEAIKATGSIEAKPVQSIVELKNVKTSSKEPVVYIVKTGDMLWKIAAQYKLTYQEIAEFNNLQNPNFIVVGQKLLIPVK